MSPDLRALVLAARHETMPTEADSARVLHGLQVRLGESTVISIVPSSVKRPIFPRGKVIGIGVMGLALVGGLWSFAGRSHQEMPTVADSLPSAGTLSPASIGSDSTTPKSGSPALVPTLDEAAAPRVATNETPKPTTRRSRDGLAAEVELLSQAEAALHAGKPALALAILNQHERKFANGILKEERIAARVQALCAAGRQGEASAQLSLLSSNSLHGNGSRRACGSSP